MNALLEAIYKLVIAEPHGVFYHSISGRFTYGEAIEGCQYPYAVFFGLASVPEDTFDEEIDEISFQVNIVSNSRDYTEAGRIVEECRELLDEKVLIVTGCRDVTIRRESPIPPWKNGDEWVASITFTGLLQKEN